MRRFALAVLLLAGIGFAVFWAITSPGQIDNAALAGHEPDAAHGQQMFAIGGCASCHAAPGAKDEDKLILAGGHRFETDFGTFIAPNISPDPTHGIGAWSDADFANAMLHGVSPEGQHYYPAFPYPSYARMPMGDVLDLWAYLKTLPVSTQPNVPHDIGFPFSIRRTVGGWKWLYMDPSPVAVVPVDLARGQYLVEGPGHCAACHTPRDALGGPDTSRWLAGAPSPEGKGRVPNITPGGGDTAGWSAADIAEYLKSGFTPDYDTAGGTMVDVIDNTAQLPDADRMAIANYLKAIPAIDGK